MNKKANLLGFECKECNRPFFMLRNTVECILDDKTEINKYKKRGFELKEYNEAVNWCNCS